jgi:hypothetical protein
MDLSVANAVIWPSEPIPDEDYLFFRVHRQRIKNGEVRPSAFQNRPTENDGMSTDWEKYSTAQESLNRAPAPDDNAIIRLSVAKIRKIPGQTVVHTPIQPNVNPTIPAGNRAHTDVFGEKEKNPEVRTLLTRAWTMVIPLRS